MTQGPPPPENLVIYEVEGVPGRSAVSGLGPGYLGLWEEGGYTFFFFDREAGEAWDRFLAERTGLRLRTVHRMKYEQWQDGARFEPFEVGPLAIVPAWEASNPWPGRLHLLRSRKLQPQPPDGTRLDHQPDRRRDPPPPPTIPG